MEDTTTLHELEISYDDLFKQASLYREESNSVRESYLAKVRSDRDNAIKKAAEYRKLADHYECTAKDIEVFLSRDHSNLPKDGRESI